MSKELSRDEVRDRLFDAIEDERTGMLGLSESRMHFQPMTAFLERDTGQIWIFSGKDTDLVRESSGGRHAMFTFHAEKRGVWACLGGELSETFDRGRLEKYWSPMVAAWYPDGKDDPNLTMLRFDLHDAEVWVERKGPLKFAFETAKANLSRELPDWGQKSDLNFQ